MALAIFKKLCIKLTRIHIHVYYVQAEQLTINVNLLYQKVIFDFVLKD